MSVWQHTFPGSGSDSPEEHKPQRKGGSSLAIDVSPATDSVAAGHPGRPG